MSRQRVSSEPKQVGSYKIGSEIGKGSFAKVYKGFNSSTQHPVAIKSVTKSKLKKKKLLENLEIEISILKTLKHPHIVELLDCEQTSTHFHLIMEYCSLGDLSYFMKNKEKLIIKLPLIKTMFNKYPSPAENQQALNKILVLNYLKQLTSSLKFLRSKNLVHRDIKPQNLLLSPPVFNQEIFDMQGFVGLAELPILKIADFGFARFLPNTSLAETLCGSPLYMAPEILNYQKYNAKADLWSVGAVLYEMAVGHPPFEAENHLDLFNKIQNSKDNISFPSYSNNLDYRIKRLISSLMRFEPSERMGFNELFNDEVVNMDLSKLFDSVNSKISLEPSQINKNLFISEYLSSDKNPYASNIGNDNTKIKQISHRDIQPIAAANAPGNGILPSPSPSPSPQNDQVDPMTTEQIINRKNMKSPSDSVVEKEYVVVEKTTVEVNALADELAHVGTGAGAIAVPSNQQLTRRRASRGSSGAGSFSSNGRRTSFNDKRIAISISPTNALSKALGLASTRLFGSVSPTNQTITPNNIEQLNAINNSNNSFTNNIILNSTNQIINYNTYKVNKDSESNITLKLETLATKAHVINLFAEMKFGQLIPSPPNKRNNSSAIESDDDELYHNSEIHQEDDEIYNELPPELVKQLCDEACSLYVKTLSLLGKAMSVASVWWYNNSDKPSSRLNEIVQWIRARFNEVLEKAEIVKLKQQQAKKRLIEINPNYFLENKEEKIYAERLIYERAIEIAKNTAKLEMSGTDLVGCELSYSTAVWMLEALLDQDDDFQKLEASDCEMIEKYIGSLSLRLISLKKKINDLNGKNILQS